MRKMSLQRHVRGEVDWLDYLVQDLYEVGVELRLSVAWREFREKALEIWRTYPCRPYTYSTSTTYLGYCSEAAELAAAQPSPAQTFPVRPCDWSETPPACVFQVPADSRVLAAPTPPTPTTPTQN